MDGAVYVTVGSPGNSDSSVDDPDRASMGRMANHKL